jgi:hypothetical protein
MPTWQRMSEQVWLCRLALMAIAALAGLMYAWATGQHTLEYYYAAADRSMSASWHNFIFGGFDPAGTITVDKLPGALWLQALSVRAFGLHTWAIILPQVIEGILAVLVLYRAVRRLAGPAAGLVAALVLAVSPATVALDRENISDSLLILLLVLAADAVSGAIAGLDAGDAGQDTTPGASDPEGPAPATAGGDHLAAGERLLPPGGVPTRPAPASRPGAPPASAGPAQPWAGSSWPACGWVWLFRPRRSRRGWCCPRWAWPTCCPGPARSCGGSVSSRSPVWSSRWCRCPG